MEKLLDRLFLKYWSIPAALLLCAAVCLPFIPEDFNGSFSQLVCAVSVTSTALLLYIIATIKHNLLPRAKRDCLAVLFVVGAESEKSFLDVKFKLVQPFEESLRQPSKTKFEVVCIRRSRLKKYDLYNKKDMVTLLMKTNCIFHVGVVYTVDNESSGENYEIEINTGVAHPKYQQTAETILAHDMITLTDSIKNVKFTRHDKIEKCKVTALSLTYIIKYLAGIVYLFAGETIRANELFADIYDSLQDEEHSLPAISWLKNTVPERYFISNTILSRREYLDYCHDKDRIHLDRMEDYLTKANTLVPDTYDYYLNMAFVHALKHRDIDLAVQCIKRCKPFKSYHDWRYSDAFLSAYKPNPDNPFTVYRKCETALRYPAEHVHELASFIENVLSDEPEKFLLHLALGLIYEEGGDIPQMKHHFTSFIRKAAGMPGYDQIIQTVKSKLLAHEAQGGGPNTRQRKNSGRTA